MVPQIRLVNIHKKYGTHTVLDNVNLEINQGDILFLIGKNGSGKSTLFNIILDIVFPDGGSIEMNLKKQNIGSCLTVPTLFPDKNAFENLRFYANQLALPNFDVRQNLMYQFFSDEYKKPVKKFSSGMKKILSLAIAFLPKEPELLLLDEPTEFLDMNAKAAVKKTLSDLNARGTTLVIATHQPDDISFFDGKCCFFAKGKIQKIMPYKTVIDEYESLPNAYQKFNPEK